MPEGKERFTAISSSNVQSTGPVRTPVAIGDGSAQRNGEATRPSQEQIINLKSEQNFGSTINSNALQSQDTMKLGQQESNA